MASFEKGPNYRTPFGRNEFLRSTQDIKTTSYTVAKDSVTAQTIDGSSQKVLQTGTVMARITSGPDSGKIGPYSTLATDGRQTLTNIVGLNNTFLPWQLLERDVEVAVVYECTAVEAWCIYEEDEGVYNNGAYGGVASTVPINVPLNTTVVDAMRGQQGLDIMFH